MKMIQNNILLLVCQTEKIFRVPNIILGTLFYLWNKVLFPHRNFELWFSSVMLFILIDLITKYFCISIKNGGMRSARRNGHLSSHKYWKGLKIKLFGYLVITLMISTLYNTFPFQNRILDLGMFIYILIDLREVQSILENLYDSGLQIGWLVVWVRGRREKLEENFKEDNNDNQE